MKALSVKQVAEKLSLGQSTIYRMVANGEFPEPFVIYGNRKAWMEEDVDAWLAKKAGRPPAQQPPVSQFDTTQLCLA
ncbi:helix-turn-helix transcriptional regulator [Pandoraea commovens]|uniref:Helix-turn-helix domain-containing protein n=1 Tax=Pandoraea commovens TaxID=2508289 RepID=A0A5E4XD29_9BURK|nr:AlpA family phage regulatory protein [Pandoraea commovens]VVE34060.1 hypothetical protein PCO31010_03821 [Pandoraea commovens]